MDQVDIATENIEYFTAAALGEQAVKVLPEAHPGFDGFHCVDCNAELPPIRLRMGRVRCVECQLWLEKHERMAPYNVEAE